MIKECRVPLRVRYSEVDRMGIAYYAHYLDWFTEGRTELLRQSGTAYRQIEEMGLLLPVLSTACRYHRPAGYDEEIEIVTSARISPTRLRCDYRLERDGVLLAEGNTEHAFVRAADMRPVNAARQYPAIYDQFAYLPPYRANARDL
ncbi:MAG: thioesterase family protein [Thermaerobacter sp.]|nr:thioesterase family protein [Thermaerobacter sp.]